jgi:hypothetical protein
MLTRLLAGRGRNEQSLILREDTTSMFQPCGSMFFLSTGGKMELNSKTEFQGI